jgi:hypothetical protein
MLFDPLLPPEMSFSLSRAVPLGKHHILLLIFAIKMLVVAYYKSDQDEAY